MVEDGKWAINLMCCEGRQAPSFLNSYAACGMWAGGLEVGCFDFPCYVQRETRQPTIAECAHGRLRCFAGSTGLA